MPQARTKQRWNGPALLALPAAETRARQAGFLDRVVKTTAWASFFIAWILLALGRNRETVSFCIGAALGLAMLWSARYTVSQVFARATSGRSRARGLAVFVAVVKYGLAGALIWRLTRWPYAHLPAFAAGVGMTQAVLFLKALGQILSGYREPAGWRDLTRGHPGKR